MRWSASAASCLVPGGQLIISTPNPDVTQNYGANLFHLREMTERQFSICSNCLLTRSPVETVDTSQCEYRVRSNPHMPLTFCGPAVPSVTVRDSCFLWHMWPFARINRIREVLEMCYLDSSVDHVAASIMNEKRFSALQFEYYKAHERIFHQ